MMIKLKEEVRSFPQLANIKKVAWPLNFSTSPTRYEDKNT